MELVDTLKEAPITLNHNGFLFNADSVEVFNGRVYIQGY